MLSFSEIQQDKWIQLFAAILLKMFVLNTSLLFKLVNDSSALYNSKKNHWNLCFSLLSDRPLYFLYSCNIFLLYEPPGEPDHIFFSGMLGKKK